MDNKPNSPASRQPPSRKNTGSSLRASISKDSIRSESTTAESSKDRPSSRGGRPVSPTKTFATPKVGQETPRQQPQPQPLDSSSPTAPQRLSPPLPITSNPPWNYSSMSAANPTKPMASPAIGSDPKTLPIDGRPSPFGAPGTVGLPNQNQSNGLAPPMPNLSGGANSVVGNLLKGPVDDNGKLKDAGLMVGIKLDLEAEVHLTARIRGDILVGLY